MQSIDFREAQKQLGEYLHSKLHGETQNGALEKRAQRLADMWWSRAPSVIMGTSGIRVTGCVLGFDIGKVQVARWKTAFTVDKHNVMTFNPLAVALGYSNGFQLYLTFLDPKPKSFGFSDGQLRTTITGKGWILVARSELLTRQWKASDELVPPPSSPLFIALERAKALGYLNLLKEPA